MSRSPYEPPDSDLDGSGSRPGPMSPGIAVAFGLAVDLGCTLVISTLVTAIWGGALMGLGMSEEFVPVHLMESPQYLLASLVIGLFCTFLGAWVAAGRVESNRQMTVAVGVGLASLLFGLLTSIGTTTDLPTWYLTAAHLLVLPGAAAGGWMRMAEKPGGSGPT